MTRAIALDDIPTVVDVARLPVMGPDDTLVVTYDEWVEPDELARLCDALSHLQIRALLVPKGVTLSILRGRS